MILWLGPMFLGAFLLAATVAQLQNPGFEAATLSGWEIKIYQKTGQDPVVRLDSGQAREGRQCLLIEARDAASAAVFQTLYLPPGSLYRLKAWIKTEALAAAGGLIEIQTPAGRVGKSRPRSGTSDWQEEAVMFRVPPPGRVRVVLANSEPGEAKGTGKIWFDGLRLEPVQEPEVRDVRIFERTGNTAIDVKQGGQFIELLCRLVPSMLAQQVDGDSFEEEPPYRFSFKREIDKPYRPWYPDGAVHVAQFSLDTDGAFNGKRSQKIVLPLPHVRAGIAQDGFYLKKGINYRLRLHLKGTGDVPVWASLGAPGGAVAGPVSLGNASATWEPAEVKLRATRDVVNATLSIQFEGPGTLWLDRIYLIGDDAVLGIWRPDVVSALKDLNPGVIRFGGTSIEGFEWEQAIGDWDRRAPFTTYWGGLEPNFVGIEEFVQLCRYVGAEPLICVRWSGKKPEDAAAEVEYLNGGSETRWGKIRAQNGHRDPYGVKYWQIGNEVGGPKYDASIKDFAQAMKGVDPAIKILSAYPDEQSIERGQGFLDYLCPHHYGAGDLEGKQADFEALRKQIEGHAGNKRVRVAVTEWNTTGGEFGLARGMLQTLGNALSCARYHNLLQRYAGLVEMAIRSNLIDSFGSGVIVTGPGWLYRSPTYYTEQLYSRAAGSYPLRLERDGDLPWHLAEPDLSATVSADGKLLRIYGVNSTAGSIRVRFHLPDFPAASKVTAYVLKDRENRGDSEAMNTPDDGDRVAVLAGPVSAAGSEPQFVFEPYSVTLLEVDKVDR
jgi:alpha-N-arabinofuranosidase